MNGARWAKEDVVFLLQNYYHISTKEIAKVLGKSVYSIYEQVKHQRRQGKLLKRKYKREIDKLHDERQWNISKIVVELAREGYI